MKLNLYDLAKDEVREIDTSSLTLLQWIKINFTFWGFYEIKCVKKNKYEITDKFTKQILYIVNA